MPTYRELADEFDARVFNDAGFEISLCGLCGNTGIVDTTKTVKWYGKPAGIRAPCICPNGRVMRRGRKATKPPKHKK